MNNYFPTAIGGKESEVQKPQKIYRKDIQALRGIAVLLVVLNHVAPNAITNGQIGVDIFFVISGFVISQSLDNSIGRRQPVRVLKTFYAARAKRILPTLSIYLLITGNCTIGLGFRAMEGSISRNYCIVWYVKYSISVNNSRLLRN